MSNDPRERVHQYFVLLQAGVPSATGNLDGASGNSHQRARPPEWLIRHCEVGNALAALKNHEREAVVRYFEASVLYEECERAMCVVDMRKNGKYHTAAKKVGINPRASRTDWDDLRWDAEKMQRLCEREMRRVGSWRSYQSGIDKVARRLNGRKGA